MSVIARVMMFGLKDLLRNKWSILYAAFFLLVTDGLLRMVAEPSKVVLSMMNIALYLIPLVSIIFGTMYFYNSREFFKLLLAQPVKRSTVFFGSFLSLSISLSAGYVIGVTVPFSYQGYLTSELIGTVMTLLGIGLCLTWAFVGLAFLIAIVVADRGKGVGLAIFVWLAFAVLYDGAVLFTAHVFSDYPLEKPLLGLSLLNPIDLGRILLLLRIDVSALMGYTGAVFERFFGGSAGVLISGVALVAWSVLPLTVGLRQFVRRDL